ncbi:MAG: hypothetical protein NTV87_13635 [Ignavibacteriae bacterium]|nr:hypothetical protein [Ignavibacteriota bacterium]
MKAESVLVLVLLLFSVTIFNSCGSNSPVYPPGTVSVSGLVRGLLNIPLDNVKITIKDKSFTTLSDGKFSFDNVTSPYDIYIKDSVRQYEAIYKNVNTDNLVINLPIFISQGLAEYNISVHYPAITPQPKGKLYFMDDEKDFAGIKDIGASVTDISVNAPPNLTLTGKIFFLSYTTDPNEHVNDYKYFASKNNVTVVSGATTEVTFLQEEMIPADEETVTCVINQPQGNNFSTSWFFLNFYNKRISYYASSMAIETYSTNNISVLMPKNLPVEFTPTLLTASDGTYGNSQQTNILPKTGTNVQINISPAPYVLTPEDYATNVDLSTVFSFQKQSISNILFFSMWDTVSNISYNLCTSDNSITLSMLSPILTNLSPNRSYPYSIEQAGVNILTVGEFLRDRNTIQSFRGNGILRHFTSKP